MARISSLPLYTQAWQSGVPIAAFNLGQLYEFDAHGSDVAGTIGLSPDSAKAWLSSKKGADAGEPNALARFAERDERDAVAENNPSKKNALLLQAFSLHAAAAPRAHDEDWPDDAWRNWRDRRATLVERRKNVTLRK